MKYLKTYEANKRIIKKYWLIPTDYRLEQSLKDIKCPKTDIKKLLSTIQYYQLYDDRFTFICYDNTEQFIDNYWGWDPFDIDEFDDGSPDLKKAGYKFMGMVNAEDLELEIAAKKYNL